MAFSKRLLFFLVFYYLFLGISYSQKPVGNIERYSISEIILSGNKVTKEKIVLRELLYSGGFGIDLVTYYDKVLRIEYSLNKFGEQGIFFHLGAPIIEK